MGAMAVRLLITILLLFHQISSSIQESVQVDQFTSPNDRDEIRDRHTLNYKKDCPDTVLLRSCQRDFNGTQQELVEARGKISALEREIDRTMTFLDLYRDGWSYLAKTTSWYKVIEQGMSFDEAVAYCASQKGHLVTIHSQEENHFVWELAKTVPSNWAFWIGLKRNPNKGNAVEWTDGSVVDFTNWGDGKLTSYTHAWLDSDDGKWIAVNSLIFKPHVSLICKRSSQF